MSSAIRRAEDTSTSTANTLKGEVDALRKTLNLYGEALGVASPQEAEKIVKEKQALQAMIGAAKKEGKLIFYGPFEVDQIETMFAAFKRKYPGIETEFVNLRGAALVERMIAEDRAGKYTVDTFSVPSDAIGADFLNRGFYAKYLSPEAKYYPKDFYHPEGYGHAVQVQIYGVTYNTDMIKPDQLPKTLEDLFKPNAPWSGKVTVDHPGRGVGGTNYIAGLKTALPENRWMTWMKGLAATKPVFQGSLTAGAKAVIAGQYALYVGGAGNDIFEFKPKGAPIDLMVIEGVLGSIAKPGPGYQFGVYTKAPHPNAARLFYNFFLSEEGMEIWSHPKWGRIATRSDLRAGMSLEKALTEFPGSKIVYTPDDYNLKLTNYQAQFRKIFVDDVGRTG